MVTAKRSNEIVSKLQQLLKFINTSSHQIAYHDSCPQMFAQHI